MSKAPKVYANESSVLGNERNITLLEATNLAKGLIVNLPPMPMPRMAVDSAKAFGCATCEYSTGTIVFAAHIEPGTVVHELAHWAKAV